MPSSPRGCPSWRSTRALSSGPALLLALGVLATPALAQEPHRAILREKLEERMAAIARDFDGVAGASVIDLATGERWGVNQDLSFPQGSAIKIPILLELFRRAEAEPGLLERRVAVSARDQVGGTGILQRLTDGGSQVSLEDLAILMITLSDNTATNMLIDALGMEPVNALMDSLEAPHTRLRRRMIQTEASARGEENVSTPAEAALLMERIARCRLPLGEASCRRVLDILEIPKADPVMDPLPGNVPVAFKPGTIEGVRTVWALVSLPDRPYVLTVMTNYGGDGGQAVRLFSEAAWEYFFRLARSTEHGTRVPLDVLRRVRPGGG